MQEGALDLQKSVCDQHKNAHFTDCLDCSHHTHTHTLRLRIEAEIGLCVGEAIKKGRFPTELSTHTPTPTYTHCTL